MNNDMKKEELASLSAQVRKVHPLVHNITNYVTVNDVANLLLAAGASPIMADDQAEIMDITSMASALNINIGTLNSRTLDSMLLAASQARARNIPAVLDPVGAGASTLRTQSAKTLMNTGKFAVIKGNLSEIKTLTGSLGHTRGVDVSAEDARDDALNAAILAARKLAVERSCIVVVTGPVDVVSDGQTVFTIANGTPLMGTITGTGCMLSALLAAYVGAAPDHPLEAAAAAVCAMGIAGQIAAERMNGLDGNGSFRMYLLDAMSHMDPKTWQEKADYEVL